MTFAVPGIKSTVPGVRSVEVAMLEGNVVAGAVVVAGRDWLE